MSTCISDEASSGANACMKSTLATDAWLSAMMKNPDESDISAATASPGRPTARNARTTEPRSETVMNVSRPSTANSARPASCVAVPTWSSRCRTPAVDQATAASAT